MECKYLATNGKQLVCLHQLSRGNGGGLFVIPSPSFCELCQIRNVQCEPKALNVVGAEVDHKTILQRLMSLPRKASKYALALAKWKAAGSPVRDEAEVSRLMAICEVCPKFVKSCGGKPKCKECGCWLKQKIPMATEECPMGKWCSPKQPQN